MLSKIWMTGCYFGLLMVPILSYWHIRWGALAALVSIVLAHISAIKKAEELNQLSQTSFLVLLEHTTSLHAKFDAMKALQPQVSTQAR